MEVNVEQFFQEKKRESRQDSEQRSWLNQVRIYFSDCWENLFNFHPNLQRMNISVEFSYVFNYIYKSIAVFVCKLFSVSLRILWLDDIKNWVKYGWLAGWISSEKLSGSAWAYSHFPCTNTSLVFFTRLRKFVQLYLEIYWVIK